MSFITNPYYVFINSRDREDGTDENFTYNIRFPTGYEFDRVVVLNALIPKSFYLVQAEDKESTFYLKENDIIVKIQVPVGSYLLSAFKTAISTVLSQASPNGITYTLTYPSISGADTGKWTIIKNNNIITSSLIFNDHFFEPFGFYLGSTNVFIGNELTSTCVIKLQSEDRLLIHSNVCDNPNDDVLVTINSTTSINYSSINYVCPAPEFYSRILSSHKNNTYNFTLTDENNELIHLNGLNLNITLLFYKVDQIFDQIRNFMKLIIMKTENNDNNK